MAIGAIAGAQAAFVAHPPRRPCGRVFHHRRDDGDARAAKQHRRPVEFARQLDLHGAQMADAILTVPAPNAKNTGGGKTSRSEQGKKLEARADSAIERRDGAAFWSGEIQTRYKNSAPEVRLFGETPGSFAARDWSLADGRLLFETDVESARDVCVLGASWRRTFFRTARPSVRKSRLTESTTPSSACWRKGQAVGRRPG